MSERVINDPVEYQRVHDTAVAAYEAAVPADYRYSALALRKAVDAAIAAYVQGRDLNSETSD
jgi:hypothetical protein